MFRSFQTTLDAGGNGGIDISPYIESVEWDIYQISIQTQNNPNCYAELRHNGFFLCGTANGSKDSATGPPDCIVQPHESFSCMWFNGVASIPGNPIQATMGVWYNENPQGTTYSSAH